MRLTIILRLAALLLFPITALTANADEAAEAKVAKIFDALGYDDLLKSMGPAIAQGASAAETRPEVARQLREAARQTYKPESIIPRVVAETQAALTPKTTLAVLGFYLTPLGQKVAALERSVIEEGLSGVSIDGLSDTRMAEYQASLEELRQAKAEDPQRFDLYRRMSTALDARERVSQFGSAILVATLTGYFAADGGPPGAGGVIINSAVSNMNQMMAPLYDQMIILHAHEAFASLSKSELQELVGALETPDSAAFFDAFNAALIKVIGADSRRFGEQMSGILRANTN